ncbi:MAG TPA: hypothetical protein VM535_01340, partial [Candidatus Saccharimonadales bacterium]|nr:hypothetical protein [Candidatus Saccharimonadales bacterium]
MKTAEKPSKDMSSLIERVPWNPWLGVVFVIILYYGAQLAGGLLVTLYPVLRGWSAVRITNWLDSSTAAQFAYVVLAEAFILGALYLFLKKYGSSFKTIGLKRPRWRDVGYGLLAVPLYYLFYLVTVALVSHFVPGLDIDQQQQTGFNNVQGTLALIMTFISLVVLPPLAEEILVRGFLYSSLKKALPALGAVL